MALDNFDKSIYRSRTAEIRRSNNLKEKQLETFQQNAQERALRREKREKEKAVQLRNKRVSSFLSRNFLTYFVVLVFAFVVLAGGQPNYRPEIVANEIIPTYTTESGVEFLDFSNYNSLDNAYLNSSPSVSIPRLSTLLSGLSVLSNSAPTIDDVHLSIDSTSWGDWGVFNWLRDFLSGFVGLFVNVAVMPVNGAIDIINFVIQVYNFFVSYT